MTRRPEVTLGVQAPGVAGAETRLHRLEDWWSNTHAHTDCGIIPMESGLLTITTTKE